MVQLHLIDLGKCIAKSSECESLERSDFYKDVDF